MKLRNLKLILVVTAILCSCTYFLPFVIPIQNLPELTKDNESFGEFFEISTESFLFYEYLFEEKHQKTLVFIHGFGGSSSDWKFQKNFFFENGYNIVSIDLLGFGRSSKTFEDNYSHIEQAQRVYRLLAELGISNVSFIGHSMGGNVIAHVGYSFPDIVDKLIFVAPAIVTEESRNVFSFLFSIPSVQRYFELFVTNLVNKERIYEILRTAFFDENKISEELIENFYYPLSFSGWSRGLLGIVRDAGQNFVDIKKVLEANNSFFVWGLEDNWVRLVDDKNQELTSGQKLFTINNSGHLPMVENVDEFNSILLDILQSE